MPTALCEELNKEKKEPEKSDAIQSTLPCQTNQPASPVESVVQKRTRTNKRYDTDEQRAAAVRQQAKDHRARNLGKYLAYQKWYRQQKKQKLNAQQRERRKKRKLEKAEETSQIQQLRAEVDQLRAEIGGSSHVESISQITSSTNNI